MSDSLSDALTDETRCAVFAVLECDQRFMIREIWNLLLEEHSIEVSHMIVQPILAAEGYTKAWVRWVPKHLHEENKQPRVNVTRNFWCSMCVIKQ